MATYEGEYTKSLKWNGHFRTGYTLQIRKKGASIRRWTGINGGWYVACRVQKLAHRLLKNETVKVMCIHH